MRKLNIYMMLLLVLFAGCNDDYLDILPKGKAIPTSTDDLAEIMNNIGSINSTGTGNGAYMADELILHEDEPAPGGPTQKAYLWEDEIYLDSENDGDWDGFYNVISRANFVLDNIDTYEKGTKYDINDTKGRALFARAHALSYLVMGYSKNYNESSAATDLGVPLPLDFDINAETERSTVKVVYDQIFSDLTAAEDLLPDLGKYNYHGSKATIYALLGRIYLYQYKYDLAAEYSKKALDLYSDVMDYNELGLYPWAMYPSQGVSGWPSNNADNADLLYQHSPPWYRGNLFYSPDLVSKFDKANDLRYRYFMTTHNASGADLNGKIMVATFGNINFLGIRTSEVYLNYCEALMRKGNAERTEALKYLNMLREKRFDSASYTDFTSDDDGETIDEIMLERRRELRLSHIRWFDMKRLGVELTRTYKGESKALKASSNNYLWAIPAYNMTYNKKLEQNPRGL
jgi:tetratricopeptide (TPR) repeat protein